MIPKKPEKIIKIVAEDLDLPKSLVDDVVSFYYKNIRKNLSSLETLRINLPGLGHFVMKEYAVSKNIKRFERMKEMLDTQTFTNYHKLKMTEAKLEALKKAYKLMEEFNQKKKVFKDGRKNQGDLEA
jgi:nucleoid DNA-binding protein